MKQAINFDTVTALQQGFIDYAQTLPNADCIRLAAQLMYLANAVQQYATISQDDLFHAKECTTLFDDVEEDDPMEPGYHLHNMLENLGDELAELADGMDECCEEA